MLPSKANSLTKLLGLFFIAISLLMAQQAYAADATGQQQQQQQQANSTTNTVPTAADMIVNLSKNLPFLFRMVTALAFVMGMIFIVMGIMRLKHAGEMRTMMSQEHSMKGPIIYLIVGAMLMYLPSAIDVGLATFWTEPNPYGYLEETDQWTQFIGTCMMIVQFFGVIAFIRGLVIIAQTAGHGGGQHGGIGKGLTHIIGGIFCINIYQFVQVFMVTLGIQSPF